MADNRQRFLWQDKLEFASRIVEKELELITQFTALINNIKYNLFPKDRINELQNYKFCWANLNNLFDVLYDDYSSELSDEEKKELERVMDKYQDIDSDEMDFNELKTAKRTILKMMSKSGFHDLVRKAEEEDDF